MAIGRPKSDPETLTIKEAEVLVARELMNKTVDETAELVGMGRDFVMEVKKKPAYHNWIIQELENKQYGVKALAEKLIQLTEKKKEINVGGKLESVDDNITQFNAVKKIGDIYGVDAPRELSVEHTIANSSDAELDKELAEAELRHRVEARPVEPTVDDGDTGQEQGTIL